MAAKKKGLGRGLTALLGNSDVETMIEASNSDELRTIDVDLIERGPWQPREHFDETALQELADSIAAQGVVQPIVVREKRVLTARVALRLSRVSVVGVRHKRPGCQKFRWSSKLLMTKLQLQCR